MIPSYSQREGWKSFRLKDVSFLYGGLTGKAGDDFRSDNLNETKPFIPFTNILNNTVIDFGNFKRVVMAPGEMQNRVRENDLLFLMSSEDYESIGKSALVEGDPGEVYLNSFCRGLRFVDRKHIVPKFINYLLLSDNYRDAIRLEARGFTRINLKIDKISSLSLSVPSVEKQQAIVKYLDTQLKFIDDRIGIKEKELTTIVKLRNSEIISVISGRHSSSFELKETGHKWIGKIPKHWSVVRIKDIASLGSGTTPKSGSDKYYDNGTIPWLNTSDVQNRLIENNSLFITDVALQDYPTLRYFPEGTVLLAMYGGGTIGNVGLMTFPATVNQACCAIVPNKRILNPKYLYYYLMSKHGWIVSNGFGGTQINLSQKMIAQFSVTLPPIEEQEMIVNYLDNKGEHYKSISNNITVQIEKLQLLKRALIYETVNGYKSVD